MISPSGRREYSLVLWFTVLTIILIACGTGEQVQMPAPSPAGQQPSALQESLAAMDEEERRKTVIWDVDVDTIPVESPDHWNPFLPHRRDKGFHQAMIEPLFILNYETGAIEPWLGESMTANEYQDVWTLTLRDGVTWSDGEPFNADDVIFTIRLILDAPELHTDFDPRESGFVSMDGLRKVDDRTIEFRLDQPNPRFQVEFFAIKIWSSFPIVPEHIWRGKDPLKFTNYDPDKGWPVFTGPYTLHRFDDTSFVYLRDDNWWGAQTGFKPLPHPEQLIWVITEDEQATLELAKAQMLDSVGDMTLEGFLELREHNPNIIAWLDDLPYVWIDPCSRLLSFNHTQAPWNSKEMRWAVNYAINREEIVEEAYQGTTIASRHFFPAYPPMEHYVQLLEDEGLYERYPLTTFDPEQSRTIIEAQGWSKGADGYYEKDGQQLTLDILVHESFIEKQRLTSVIVEQLQEADINATMHLVNSDVWIESKATGTYAAINDWDACASIHEPWSSMYRYHRDWVRPVGELGRDSVTIREITQNNHIRWDNRHYSDLVDAMGKLPMGDSRIDYLFVDAMEIWFDELPFIPITQARKLVPFDTTYWIGWPTAGHNYIQPPTWWQSTHVIIHNLEPATPQE